MLPALPLALSSALLYWSGRLLPGMLAAAGTAPSRCAASETHSSLRRGSDPSSIPTTLYGRASTVVAAKLIRTRLLAPRSIDAGYRFVESAASTASAETAVPANRRRSAAGDNDTRGTWYCAYATPTDGLRSCPVTTRRVTPAAPARG